MNANLIVAVLFVALAGCGVTALCICVVAKACDSWYGDLDEDAHAQLVDDMHLAKVAHISDAMKTDREKALGRMAQNAREIGMDLPFRYVGDRDLTGGAYQNRVLRPRAEAEEAFDKCMQSHAMPAILSAASSLHRAGLISDAEMRAYREGA